MLFFYNMITFSKSKGNENMMINCWKNQNKNGKKQGKCIKTNLGQ